MKVLYRATFRDKEKEHTIYFGIPENKSELGQMFSLRYESYLEHGYIEPNDSQVDIDEYDNLDNTYYIIAILNGEIVGTARLIKSQPLPTIGDCYTFKEPSEITGVEPSKLGEISRLIARYPLSPRMPVHTILFGILNALSSLAEIYSVEAGYCFVKKTLYDIFSTVNVVVHKIEPYQQKYNKTYLLKYFQSESNPVCPVYFTTQEIKDSLLAINEAMQKAGLTIVRYET